MTLKEFCCAALFSVVLYGAAAGQPPLVFFNSPCECVGSHGEYRWLVKTDAETPPGSISPDHKIKPSDVGAWLGPGGKFHEDTPRSDKENQWFEVTGRVTLVRAEADGDLHIQLMDADGANPVNVVVEVPCSEPWCEIRKQVFGWAKRSPPFTTRSSTKFTLKQQPVIRVVGKAFYDAAHAGKNTTGNRRPNTPSAAVTIWEIHPVMKLEVISN